MSTPTLPELKQGDTFALVCTYSENGVTVALTSYTVTSQLRTSGGDLVESLVVTKDPDQTANRGKFRLTRASEATRLAVGWYHCDIQFEAAGTVRSSETFIVPVEPDVTRA